MSVQNLIEKYKKKYAEEPRGWGAVDESRRALFANFINDLEQLDEPKRVVVPKFVADWIKYAKQQGYGFMQSYDPKYTFYPINDNLDKWIDENEETFARAWLNGYEVEKEPLYYVKLPGVGYLNNADGGIKHTEQEIKAIDERYWPFAVKVEEE